MEMKRRKQYRPRLLTVVVSLVIAGIVILANLSFERDVAGRFYIKSYGWPVIWHRYVMHRVAHIVLAEQTIGWHYSRGRLAVNVALWIMILFAPGAGWEWLLRRHRPSFRWSLKAQLAAVALAAAVCAWFASARRRADIQDAVIAELDGAARDALPDPMYHTVSVERWGPKWLDLVGADRYRRRVVAVNLSSSMTFWPRRPADEQLLARVARLPDLRCLSFEVDHVSSAMSKALNDMRRLQRLTIMRKASDGEPPPIANALLPPIGKMTLLCELELRAVALDEKSVAGLASLKSLSVAGPFADQDGAARLWDTSLGAVGKCGQLEHLSLWHVRIHGESLASLRGLKNLRTLSLWLQGEVNPFLRHLPLLARLESLTLAGEDFGDDDIEFLSRLACLKSLRLENTSVTPAGLKKLTSLDSLEEITLDGSYQPRCRLSAALDSLQGIRSLARLHLGYISGEAELALDDGAFVTVPRDDVDAARRSLSALREARLGIVVDCAEYSSPSSGCAAQPMGQFSFDALSDRQSSWLPRSDAPLMSAAWRAEFEARGGWTRFDAAADPPDFEGDSVREFSF